MTLPRLLVYYKHLLQPDKYSIYFSGQQVCNLYSWNARLALHEEFPNLNDVTNFKEMNQTLSPSQDNLLNSINALGNEAYLMLANCDNKLNRNKPGFNDYTLKGICQWRTKENGDGLAGYSMDNIKLFYELGHEKWTKEEFNNLVEYSHGSNRTESGHFEKTTLY